MSSPKCNKDYLSSLQSNAQNLEQKIEINARWRLWRKYPNCFVAADCVKTLQHLKLAKTDQEAIDFANKLIEANLIECVECNFGKNNKYYRFTEHYHNSKSEPQESKSDTPTVKIIT